MIACNVPMTKLSAELRRQIPNYDLKPVAVALQMHKNPEVIFEATDTPYIREIKRRYIIQFKKSNRIMQLNIKSGIIGIATGIFSSILKHLIAVHWMSYYRDKHSVMMARKLEIYKCALSADSGLISQYL